MNNKPFVVIETCVVAVAMVLGASVIAGCFYKPASIIGTVQIGGGYQPSAVSRTTTGHCRPVPQVSLRLMAEG